MQTLQPFPIADARALPMGLTRWLQRVALTGDDNTFGIRTPATGGTGADLSAALSVGGLVYSTATAFGILAGTPTAGQIVRSGASAAPTWSTATYPATAGASGLALVSDGTNFVSTAVVNTITGTADQVIASAASGAVTLSLPQAIATTSTPQFAKLGLGQAAGTELLEVAGNISALRTLTLTHATNPRVILAKTDATAQSWSLNGGDAANLYDTTAGTTALSIAKTTNVVTLPAYGAGLARFSAGGAISSQAASSAYTVTNPSTDRALNVTVDTLAQGLAVLGTLIADLQTAGILS